MRSPLSNSERTDAMNAKGPPSPGTFLTLPSEILDCILNFLNPVELAHTSGTCRRLYRLVGRDSRWESFVHENVARPPGTAQPHASFKDLYKAHSPFWFLSRHKLWFSDSYPHGKLIVARYDYRSGCLEGYAIAAKPHRPRSTRVLDWEHGVVYQMFQPVVQLDLNQPVIRIGSNISSTTSEEGSTSKLVFGGTKFQAETRLEMPSSLRNYSSHITQTLMRVKNLPQHLCDSRTSLWPPLRVPSPGNGRTRASSTSSFVSVGHKPTSQAEAAGTAFRIRKTLNFHPFTPLQSIFSTVSTTLDGVPADHVETFGTVDPQAYTPTAEKPWQGIFVGDYSSHGCEFLLITQPDPETARPLPHKARRALERWPNSTQWQALLVDAPGEEDEVMDDDADVGDGVREASMATSLPAAIQMRQRRMSRGEELPDVFTHTSSQDVVDAAQSRASGVQKNAVAESRDQPPFKGRLEAIKLTGDPNVPRGEITFVADDLGERGLVGYTKERDFVESKAASEGRLESSSVQPGAERELPQSNSPSRQEQPSSGAADHFVAELDAGEPPTRHETDPDFSGTRMVRSVGHICETRPPRRESYIPSQLMLISPNRIAQYWMPYQHVSFYERVEWEQFLDVD